jgi:hypothetical protein
MSNVFTQLFIDSFVRGVGKTSGALITMFVGWQMFKVTNGHDEFLSFLLGKCHEKRRVELQSKFIETEQELSEPDHEEINVKDMENEKKFKTLFDRV